MSIAHHAELRSPARSGVRELAAVLVPVLIVAGMLGAALSARLAAYRGNVTGFIQFGSQLAHVTHPPAGAVLFPGVGYDGQFFYVQGLDPLLLHNSTVNALRAGGAGFRMQRAAYPALAFILSGGQRGALPVALLATNVLVLLALTAGFAAYARRRGWSSLWAVAIGLMPGMLLPALRDLSDPLATASLLAGVLLWCDGRRWAAAGALTIAVLTREVTVVAIVGMAFEAGMHVWRRPGSWRSVGAHVWPILGLPVLAFAAWRLYITARYGGGIGGAELEIPLSNLITEVNGSIHTGLPMLVAWDVVYVLLILAASLTALVSVCRRVTIPSVAACAVALGVLIPNLGDVWSDSRLAAPLFVLLLVDGLQRRSRWAMLIGAAAASMSLLIPFAIPGTF